jgi:hypothetical protein
MLIEPFGGLDAWLKLRSLLAKPVAFGGKSPKSRGGALRIPRFAITRCRGLPFSR